MNKAWKNNMGWQAKLSQLSINHGMVQLPQAACVHMKTFTEIRGSDNNILYWSRTLIGPGVRKTTYTIWNK